MSLRVYLLFSKYYREVVFNAFSIQKIQRGRIFLLELTNLIKGLTDKEQKPVIIYVLKYKFPN